jgi:hypothetical protein
VFELPLWPYVGLFVAVFALSVIIVTRNRKTAKKWLWRGLPKSNTVRLLVVMAVTVLGADYISSLTAHVQTSLGVVLAGGFDHRNLRARIASLASNFTFSIDAEGKLRGKNDVLYGGGAKRYLLEADRIFREYMQV